MFTAFPVGCAAQDEELGDIPGHSAVQLFIATTRALQSDFLPNGETFQQLLQYVGASMAFRWPSIWRQLALPHLASAGRRGLDNHLGLLTGGRRTALPRHQTLRATLDWSYELCRARAPGSATPAAFVSDFTAAAASLVAAGGEIAALEVVLSLANLVTKSLVTVEVGSVTAYYRLHETTRGYALEKLAESGEFEQVARRHANYYRTSLTAPNRTGDIARTAWLARYGRHVGQARAALDWAFSPTGAAEVGVALTVAAVPLWCTCR